MTFSKVGGEKKPKTLWADGPEWVFHIAGDKFQHIGDVEPLVTTDRKSCPSQSRVGLESADRQTGSGQIWVQIPASVTVLLLPH